MTFNESAVLLFYHLGSFLWRAKVFVVILTFPGIILYFFKLQKKKKKINTAVYSQDSF